MTICGADLTNLPCSPLAFSPSFYVMSYPTESTVSHSVLDVPDPWIPVQYLYLPQGMAMCPLPQASPYPPRSAPRTGQLATSLGDRLASSTHLPPPSRTLPVSSWCIFRRDWYLISSNHNSPSCKRTAYQSPYFISFWKESYRHSCVISKYRLGHASRITDRQRLCRPPLSGYWLPGCPHLDTRKPFLQRFSQPKAVNYLWAAARIHWVIRCLEVEHTCLINALPCHRS
jgi:hypothetical protein